jgi:hypothetical protein
MQANGTGDIPLKNCKEADAEEFFARALLAVQLTSVFYVTFEIGLF